MYRGALGVFGDPASCYVALIPIRPGSCFISSFLIHFSSRLLCWFINANHAEPSSPKDFVLHSMDLLVIYYYLIYFPGRVLCSVVSLYNRMSFSNTCPKSPILHCVLVYFSPLIIIDFRQWLLQVPTCYFFSLVQIIVFIRFVINFIWLCPNFWNWLYNWCTGVLYYFVLQSLYGAKLAIKDE